jgi:hypothetical protein
MHEAVAPGCGQQDQRLRFPASTMPKGVGRRLVYLASRVSSIKFIVITVINLDGPLA